mmetsp:Transcript_883/g.2527  ORF Transcript_883/g.2527 Transcript_883/m.2527 type:complete len:566 (-) Transcript_883:302-1999(-)
MFEPVGSSLGCAEESSDTTPGSKKTVSSSARSAKLALLAIVAASATARGASDDAPFGGGDISATACWRACSTSAHMSSTSSLFVSSMSTLSTPVAAAPSRTTTESSRSVHALANACSSSPLADATPSPGPVLPAGGTCKPAPVAPTSSRAPPVAPSIVARQRAPPTARTSGSCRAARSCSGDAVNATATSRARSRTVVTPAVLGSNGALDVAPPRGVLKPSSPKRNSATPSVIHASPPDGAAMVRPPSSQRIAVSTVPEALARRAIASNSPLRPCDAPSPSPAARPSSSSDTDTRCTCPSAVVHSSAPCANTANASFDLPPSASTASTRNMSTIQCSELISLCHVGACSSSTQLLAAMRMCQVVRPTRADRAICAGGASTSATADAIAPPAATSAGTHASRMTDIDARVALTFSLGMVASRHCADSRRSTPIGAVGSASSLAARQTASATPASPPTSAACCCCCCCCTGTAPDSSKASDVSLAQLASSSCLTTSAPPELREIRPSATLRALTTAPAGRVGSPCDRAISGSPAPASSTSMLRKSSRRYQVIFGRCAQPSPDCTNAA